MFQRPFRKILLAILTSLIMAVTASAANATTYYLQDVVFDDGTVVTGRFSTNVSGYPDGHDITTQDGALTGYHYINNINVSYNPGDSSITFYHFSPPYDGYLTLQTLFPIDSVALNPLVLGGASHECSTYSCPGGTARSIVSGYLTISAVPEPATWGLLIVGFGAIGLTLRRSRGRGGIAGRIAPARA
jgi:hypothetical protein